MAYNPEIKERVIAWLRQAEKGFKTQAELCRQADISLRSYQDWLNKGTDPRLSAFLRVASVADKSIDVLVWPERNTAGGEPNMATVLDAMQGLEEWLHEQDKEINDPAAKRRLVEALAEMAWKDRNQQPSGEVVNFTDYAPFMRAVTG